MVFLPAINDILRSVNIDPLDGIHIVLPNDTVTKPFHNSDSQHRLDSHLQVKLNLLLVSPATARLGEHILV
jgi:hypothetical protein